LQPATTGNSASGTLPVFFALFALGLLLLSATAVPPTRIPWVVVAESLYSHRSDLAVTGIGAIALALIVLNVGFLL
jgi:hypothetical protein